jgi:hypothetical protein
VRYIVEAGERLPVVRATAASATASYRPAGCCELASSPRLGWRRCLGFTTLSCPDRVGGLALQVGGWLPPAVVYVYDWRVREGIGNRRKQPYFDRLT